MREKDLQNSPGVLIRNNIEVDIAQIKFLAEIPAFTTPSKIEMPLLANVNGKFFCISGEEIINNARKQNQKTIQCLVEDHSNNSAIELGFRKVSFRMVPEGGRCSYGEKVRAIKSLEMLIKNFSEDIIVNGHGGDRRSGEFHHNDSHDLRAIIEEKLQIDRDTVNTYLNYAKYLNDETLNFFAEQQAKKVFFEMAQIHKRRLIENFQANLIDVEEITSQISTKMQAWFHDYSENGRISEPVEENIQNEADIVLDQIIENEAQEIDSEIGQETIVGPAELRQPELIPVQNVPTNENILQAQSQVRKVIMDLSKVFSEEIDLTTIFKITSQAAIDLQEIFSENQEVING